MSAIWVLEKHTQVGLFLYYYLLFWPSVNQQSAYPLSTLMYSHLCVSSAVYVSLYETFKKAIIESPCPTIFVYAVYKQCGSLATWNMYISHNRTSMMKWKWRNLLRNPNQALIDTGKSIMRAMAASAELNALARLTFRLLSTRNLFLWMHIYTRQRCWWWLYSTYALNCIGHSPSEWTLNSEHWPLTRVTRFASRYDHDSKMISH